MMGRAGHETAAAAAAAARTQSYRWLSGDSEVQKVGVGAGTGNSQSRPPSLVVRQSTAGSAPEQLGFCSLVPRTRFIRAAVIKWITTSIVENRTPPKFDNNNNKKTFGIPFFFPSRSVCLFVPAKDDDF